MADKSGRDSSRERLDGLPSMKSFPGLPLDFPYKVDKVLEYDRDRTYSQNISYTISHLSYADDIIDTTRTNKRQGERFSRGESGEQIRPCWQWDQKLPPGEVMSTAEAETLQDPQEQPTEFEPGNAEWAFPENPLSNDPAPDAVYGALPDSSWFRLLIVQPSEDMWAPLQCQLRAFKRRDTRGKYEALSYAWKEGDHRSRLFWAPETGKLVGFILRPCLYRASKNIMIANRR